MIENKLVRTVAIDYAEGLRYFVLTRDESKPDVLAQILSTLPRTPTTDSSPRGINRSRRASSMLRQPKAYSSSELFHLASSCSRSD